MRIEIIGPSKIIKNPDEVSRVAELIVKLGHEIVVTADKGSASGFFARDYAGEGERKFILLFPWKIKSLEIVGLRDLEKLLIVLLGEISLRS